MQLRMVPFSFESKEGKIQACAKAIDTGNGVRNEWGMAIPFFGQFFHGEILKRCLLAKKKSQEMKKGCEIFYDFTALVIPRRL